MAEQAPSVLAKYGGAATQDQVPDQTVMSEASPEDRATYFSKAVLSESKERWSNRLPDYASQSVLTREEMKAINLVSQSEKTLGSEPIQIGGKNYQFVKSGSSQLIGADYFTISPLLDAIKGGRSEMIRRAREAAYQEFGVEAGSLDNQSPPKWWTKAEHLERLNGDEVLVFIPAQQPDQSPSSFANTLRQNPQFKTGWHLVKIDRERHFIKEASHLL